MFNVFPEHELVELLLRSQNPRIKGVFLMGMATKLRELLGGDEIVVAPGAWDAVSAKAIEQAGFPAVYITGYGLEASVLGSPDVGLMSFGEILDRVGKISAAVNVPTILDAEAGFGGPIQVMRAVKEFERAGVAAIHIEDQVSPKKCGSMLTKKVIPIPEAVANIKAALDARTDPDFIIIARTDADVVSFEEVVTRCNSYLEAGADMVMPVTAGFRGGTTAELAEACRRLAREIKGPSVALRIDLAGMTAQEAQAAGYKLAIYPVFALFAATQATIDAVTELKTAGIPTGYFQRHPGMGMKEFNEFIGMPKVLELEGKYAVK